VYIYKSFVVVAELFKAAVLVVVVVVVVEL